MNKVSFFFLFLICSVGAYAQSPFEGGSGTANDPYQIATVEQLDSVRNHNKSHFELVSDLDFSGSAYSEETGVNWPSLAFFGSFNGKGHTIKNLYINSNQRTGLFGWLNGAVIDSIVLEDVNIISYEVGGIAGHAESTTISNCSVSGIMIANGNSSYCGGIVGESVKVTINKCSVTGYVAGYDYVGGIVGVTYNQNPNYITNSYFNGTVKGNAVVGGIMGGTYGGYIKNCYATGTVRGSHVIGGITGTLTGNGNLEKCFFVGTISEINNKYSKAQNTRGAICGSAGTSKSVTDCYYCTDVFGGTNNGFGTGASLLAMKKASTFSNWDFTENWEITDNNTFPRLKDVYDRAVVVALPQSIASLGSSFTFNFETYAMDATITSTTLASAPSTMTLSGSQVNWTVDSLPYVIPAVSVEDANNIASKYYFSIQTHQLNGNGTTNDPIKISTVAEFDSIRKYPQAHYVLMNDLDFDGVDNWEGIGMTADNIFSGTLDGNGHSIKNFQIVKNNAIFREIKGATIENLNVRNVFGNDSWSDKGALIGRSNYSTINNCNAIDCYITGFSYVGGLIGNSIADSISNCSAQGTVVGVLDGAQYLGGLTGYSYSDELTNCYSTCDVKNGKVLGGLVGLLSKSNIRQCYATGSITAVETAGGLIGQIAWEDDNNTIKNCFALGNVTANESLGGLIGMYNNCSLKNCYAVGKLIGGPDSKNIGGIFGGFSYGSSASNMANCLYNNETCGISTNDKGVQRATWELQSGSNLGNEFKFDMTNVWDISNFKSYMYLRDLPIPPMAFEDALSIHIKINLGTLADNDFFDGSSGDKVFKIEKLYGSGTIDSDLNFKFPVGTPLGYMDSLEYRVGQINSTTGDTLWGGHATVDLEQSYNYKPNAANDSISINEDEVITDIASIILKNDGDYDSDSLYIHSLFTTNNGTVSENAGKYSYTPNTNWNGRDTLTCVITDGNATKTSLFFIKIAPANDAPVITSKAPTTASTGKLYSYTVEASDIDGDALSYSLTNEPAGMTITNNVISWTPASGITTSGDVTLTVDDGDLSATEIFTIQVKENNSPVIVSTAPVSAVQDVEYVYTVQASDIDGDELTYSLSGEPNGMVITDNVITWTPIAGVLSSGEITLKVSDGLFITSQKFTISVNNAPKITSVAPTKAIAGVEYTYAVFAEDANNDALTYTLSKHPNGMLFTNKVITWTPSADITTPVEVIITVSDGSLTDTEEFVINVEINYEPVINSVAPTSVTKGEEYTYTVDATDENGDALTYTLDNEPGGMAIVGNVITWTPEEGITTSGEVTLTVSDPYSSTTEKFTVSVIENHEPVISSTAPTSATIGEEYTYTVQATDEDGDVLTYTLVNAPDGMVITNNVITWTPADGTTTSGEVTLTVNDGNFSVSEKFTVSIITTGIEELYTEIRLYPNPATDFVLVSADKRIESVELYSIQGKLIRTEKYGEKAVRVDVSALNQGIYILKVKINAQFITDILFIE